MDSFRELRERFRPLYDAVKDLHQKSPLAHRGHGFDHDVTVAALAVRIAPDQRTAEKAFAAALLHSIDRMMAKASKGEIDTCMRVCLARLPDGTFNMDEIDEIVEAALRHGELNQDDQSLTQQVLMDADRLANMMPSVIIRSGQFRPDIPPFEFKYLNNKANPASTYHDPISVLDDLRITLRDYMPQFRIDKAKKLAKTYAFRLRTFVRAVELTNLEIGLVGIEL
jgi:HD superfamily phosphodiesterase